jgi:hypothetical protein
VTDEQLATLGFGEAGVKIASIDPNDLAMSKAWQITAEPSIPRADTASAPGAIDVCTGSSLAWEDTSAMNGQAGRGPVAELTQEGALARADAQATAPQGNYALAGFQEQAAPRATEDRATVEAEKQPAE